MRLINNDKLYWIFISGSVATPLLRKTRIDQSATILVESRIVRRLEASSDLYYLIKSNYTDLILFIV